MLSKTAQRASRITPISRSAQPTHRVPSIALSLHRYASSRPPKSNPPSQYTSSSRAQNSTGPRIKLQSPSNVNKSATPNNAQSPVQGKRVQEPVGSAQRPVRADASFEPVAQQADIDSPPTGGIREETQSQQATAENITAPPSQPEQVSEETAQPSQPLPDLRQGIPSTLDLEFDQGKTKESSDDALDITEKEAGSSGRRGSEEDDYSRADFQTSLDKRRARFLNYSYLLAAAGLALGGAYFTRPFGGDEPAPAGFDTEDSQGWSPGKMYRRGMARVGDRLGYYTEPAFPKLLPTVPDNQKAPYTLVLSLEDLMVHSTWDRANGYRMAKRPGIDYFIRYLSPYYELVLFTTVPIGMADPVIKKLDPYHFIMWPLGREATKYENGEFVKDLSYLNRDLSKTLIIDTKAGHVKNQPENAIVLPKWSGDPKDPHTNDLVALIPFLEYIATMNISDVREVIKSFEGKHIPTEFARREAIAREEFNKQLAEQRSKKPKMSLGAVFGGGLGIKADRSSGMILSDGQSVAEGLAQGKMLSDQIREQGQRQYEYLEKQIREQGAQWLKEEEEEQKKMMDAQMSEIKKNPLGSFARFFGGGEPPKPQS